MPEPGTVIDGLDHCREIRPYNSSRDNCDSCPYKGKMHCIEMLADDAQFLIVRMLQIIRKQTEVNSIIISPTRCKDCQYYEQDHFCNILGNPVIVAHHICTFWGSGCVTDPEGWCFHAMLRPEGGGAP